MKKVVKQHPNYEVWRWGCFYPDYTAVWIDTEVWPWFAGRCATAKTISQAAGALYDAAYDEWRRRERDRFDVEMRQIEDAWAAEWRSMTLGGSRPPLLPEPRGEPPIGVPLSSQPVYSKPRGKRDPWFGWTDPSYDRLFGTSVRRRRDRRGSTRGE